MGVKSNLPEVRARRQAVFAGDEGRVKAQKDLGKLTARERLTALFDAASFVELNALNEDAGVVAGFGTIDGRGAYAFAQDFTVGLGAVGDAHAKKIAKVVELARDSGSPVIGIYDTAGAQLMFALAEAGNARVSVVCGQAVGMGYAALASRAAADVTYAWPGSVIAPLTAAATVQVLEPEKLDGAKDPIARRAELEAQVAAASALTGAELGLVDDVIEPALTRQMVAAALNMLESKRTIKPAKKQGNLPL